MKTFRSILLLTAVPLAVLALAAGFWIWLTLPSGEGAHVHATSQMATNIVWLETGLDADEQVLWHHLSEGSEVVPLSVLEALISPKTGRPFLSSLADYGFMLESDDPHHLPIGWTVKVKDLAGRKVPFVGINCSGCHTGELQYQGKSVRIDGAPNLYQLEDFFVDLDRVAMSAMSNRLDSLLLLRRVIRLSHVGKNEGDFLNIPPAAIARLDEVDVPPPAAAEMPTYGPQVRARLRGSKTNGMATMKDAGMNTSSEFLASLTRDGSYLNRRLQGLHTVAAAINCGVDLGPGRGDSFGIIRRLLWAFDRIELDAPVSTPHLFNFGQFEWLHWDGNTTSVMQRNVAQAIALGADFDTATFKSSVLPWNLHRLEQIARKLKPPVWPTEIFGAIDSARADRGKALYEKNCLQCHDRERLIALDRVGTSPMRASNFARPLAFKAFPDALGAMAAFAETALFNQHGLTPQERRQLEPDGDPVWRSTMMYQARPLVGIWATAPFLHNGSIPTLYDLLQPATNRPASFPIGHRDFDPKKLGFTTDVAKPVWTFDATIEANHNIGHEGAGFGTDLTEESKWDLIEYMKTL